MTSLTVHELVALTETDKLVGDWISAPSPNFVAMATRVGPNILHGSIESAIPENPPVGPNISGLSVVQAELGNFGR